MEVRMEFQVGFIIRIQTNSKEGQSNNQGVTLLFHEFKLYN